MIFFPFHRCPIFRVPRNFFPSSFSLPTTPALHQSLVNEVLPRAYQAAQAHAESAAMIEEKARKEAAQRESEEKEAKRRAAIQAAEEARRVEAAQQAEVSQ